MHYFIFQSLQLNILILRNVLAKFHQDLRILQSLVWKILIVDSARKCLRIGPRFDNENFRYMFSLIVSLCLYIIQKKCLYVFIFCLLRMFLHLNEFSFGIWLYTDKFCHVYLTFTMYKAVVITYIKYFPEDFKCVFYYVSCSAFFWSMCCLIHLYEVFCCWQLKLGANSQVCFLLCTSERWGNYLMINYPFCLYVYIMQYTILLVTV